MTEVVDEVPAVTASSLVGSPQFGQFGLLNAFQRKAEADQLATAACDGGVEEQVDPGADPSSPVVSPSKRSSKMSHNPSVPPIVTPTDLAKAVAEGGFMTAWDPRRWHWVKTLATAASGQGSVELMLSHEHDTQAAAVKRLPWALMRSSPQEFNQQYPKAKERPWMDIAIIKHLNKLGFPCVCNHLGVFLGHEQVYIATSFGSRGDLFGWCQHEPSPAGPERETTMRPFVGQIFSGVCWLHNLGIAHRDLSVENVLLTDTSDGGLQVKIIDFGMASLNRLTSRSSGKRSYQAPEMHLGGEYDAFLADIFAVGVIVYSMGVRYYPWEQTKPGKDRSCEFARTHGLELFLHRKRMPCEDKRPIAEVFSRAYIDLLLGILSFAPETRWSLGEECFVKSLPRGVNSKSTTENGSTPTAKSMPRQTSDVSTTDSVGSNSGENQEVLNLPVDEINLDPNLEDDEPSHQSHPQRTSVWESQWMLVH